MRENDGLMTAESVDDKLQRWHFTCSRQRDEHVAESALNCAQAVGVVSSYSAILAALPPDVSHKLGSVTANIVSTVVYPLLTSQADASSSLRS